ncbi:MAG: GntR family transcriptional regulator [Phycisphaerae bacterium]|nr:GntR family transcriptional regulator [Phycisphaerae bacterium]
MTAVSTTRSKEVLGRFSYDGSRSAAKHEQLADFLRQCLNVGFEDGDRFFSERELIKQVGLSQPTVRTAIRTLSNEGLLNHRPRQGVFVCKPGIQPCIGVVVQSCDSPVTMRLLDELGGASAEHGMVIQLFHTHQGTRFAEVANAVERTARLRGVVLVGEDLDFTLEAHAHFEAARIPSVSLGWTPDDAPGSCVTEDHTAAARRVFDHLERLQHRHIAVLITNPLTGGPVRDRVQCFRADAEQRPDLSVTFVDCEVPPSGDTFALVHKRMPEVLAAQPRPSALVAISDWGAMAVMQYARTNGLSIPADLALVGYDDMPMAAVIDPGLTTIAKPYHAMAAGAVEWLASGAGKRIRHFCEPRLIVRESSRPVTSILKHSPSTRGGRLARKELVPAG